MSETRVPTDADWRSEQWGIDTPDAYRNFFGKNIVEASDLFVIGPRGRAEDVMHMPTTCFRYYLHAYMDYLLSNKSAGRASGAYSFFDVVECRSDDINGSDAVLRSRVREVLDRLRDGQQWFDAEPEIYGDFSVRADEVLKLIGG
jgi:hypothetical protein